MDHRAQQSLIATASVGYGRITSVKSCKAVGKVVQNGTLALNLRSPISGVRVADCKRFTGRGSGGWKPFERVADDAEIPTRRTSRLNAGCLKHERRSKERLSPDLSRALKAAEVRRALRDFATTADECCCCPNTEQHDGAGFRHRRRVHDGGLAATVGESLHVNTNLKRTRSNCIHHVIQCVTTLQRIRQHEPFAGVHAVRPRRRIRVGAIRGRESIGIPSGEVTWRASGGKADTGCSRQCIPGPPSRGGGSSK